MLPTSQIKKLAEAMRIGSPLVMKSTTKQSGRFFGTLLASIDVPLLLKALPSNGIQAYSRYQLPPPKSDGSGMQVRTYNESLVPHRPPPFVGSWSKGGEVYPQAAPPFVDSWPN